MSTPKRLLTTGATATVAFALLLGSPADALADRGDRGDRGSHSSQSDRRGDSGQRGRGEHDNHRENDRRDDRAESRDPRTGRGEQDSTPDIRRTVAETDTDTESGTEGTEEEWVSESPAASARVSATESRQATSVAENRQATSAAATTDTAEPASSGPPRPAVADRAGSERSPWNPPPGTTFDMPERPVAVVEPAPSPLPQVTAPVAQLVIIDVPPATPPVDIVPEPVAAALSPAPRVVKMDQSILRLPETPRPGQPMSSWFGILGLLLIPAAGAALGYRQARAARAVQQLVTP
ncbi:hypothetical protein [Mycobacterium sp. C31M]